MSKNNDGSRLDQKAANDSPRPRHLATRLQHTDWRPPEGFAAVPEATHRGSTVLFPDVAALRSRDWRNKAGYTYGLHGTPTTFTLERRLAEIEGAEHALLCPSGLAAIALVDFAMLRGGGAVLIPANAYGPGRDLARGLLAGFGVEVRIYDPLDVAATRALFDERVRLMWLEAPGSVTLEMPDLRALIALAREHGVTTALDNTWSAGIALQPFGLGVDISVQALTKYQSGGADLLMGAVMTRDDGVHERLSLSHMMLGIGVGADDVALVLRGLPSLELRYSAHDASTRAIAAWLLGRPEVERVNHPALRGSPGHAFWERDFSAAGGLVSFALRAGDADRLVDALELFGIGYSWGGPRSLAVPYRMRELRGDSWTGPESMIRLAIGLEHPDDLIEDLEQALGQAGDAQG